MRSVGTLMLSLSLLGCRPDTDPQPPAPIERVAEPEPVATTTTMTIVVRDSRGAPLRSGHVRIHRANYQAPVLDAALPEDGRLTVELPFPTAFTLKLDGDEHFTEYLHFATTAASLELTAQLGHEGARSQLDLRGGVRFPGYEAQRVLKPFRDPIIELLRSEPSKEDMPAIAATVATKTREARARIEAIDDPELRNAATLESLWFATLVRLGLLDAEALAWVFERFPPDDPYWLFAASRLHNMLGLDAPIVQAHRAAMAEQQTDPGLLAELLALELVAAEQRGDPAAPELYARLARDYPGTVWTAQAAARYDPARPLQPGKPMPEWSFPALDQSTQISSATLAGKPYLLDIWSTWCGPCVAELPDLHAAHAEFGAAIEFVSLSMDEAPANVAKLREQTPMPWTHAWVPVAEQQPLHERWTFSGFPTLILVDEHGVIVAVNDELRREQLLPTLREFSDRHEPE